MAKPTQAKLDELFKTCEFDPSNEFEMRVWVQVVRIVTDFPPPGAVPLTLALSWQAVFTSYSALQRDPNEERLTDLTAKLDNFLVKFEKFYGKKWSD
jgi:hypothetical protein